MIGAFSHGNTFTDEDGYKCNVMSAMTLTATLREAAAVAATAGDLAPARESEKYQ